MHQDSRYKADVMAIAASKYTARVTAFFGSKFLLFISDTRSFKWLLIQPILFCADLRAPVRLFQPNFTSARYTYL
jgi:hypothetical protein